MAGLGSSRPLRWLRAIRLGRIPLPEYGLAALLAWRALVATRGDRASTYVAAAPPTATSISPM